MSTLVVLVTVNAKYYHRNAAIQSLKVNSGNLRESIEILEFSLEERPEDIVEKIINTGCRIAAFSIYIWNSVELFHVIGLLKQVKPEILIIAGGPEVSYEYAEQPFFNLTDHLICGEGEEAFPVLCNDILAGKKREKVISANPCTLQNLVYPPVPDSEELKSNRLIYIETSRGCPFNCHFCISGEDSHIRQFNKDRVLEYLDSLYENGLNHFKFLDRSMVNGPFKEILQWFSSIDSSEISIHFELNPDSIPPSFFDGLFKIEKTQIQLELGIQTFNEEVLKRIGRKQNNELAIRNIKKLLERPNIHIHSDLIAGLPGETVESIGRSFDKLYSTGVHEIQFGILKRLRGAMISVHTDEFSMNYSPFPPYSVLSTSTISFQEIQELKRFARYLDLVFNSGNFYNSSRLIMGADPFNNFNDFSKWLWSNSGMTHKISRDHLARYIFTYLITKNSENPLESIRNDYERLNHVFPKNFSDPEPEKHKTIFFRRQKKHRKQELTDN